MWNQLITFLFPSWNLKKHTHTKSFNYSHQKIENMKYISEQWRPLFVREEWKEKHLELIKLINSSLKNY